jgi:hypothetical protein
VWVLVSFGGAKSDSLSRKMLKDAAFWIMAHWKYVTAVIAVVSAIGGAVMWWPKYRLARAQRRQFEQDVEIKSFAEAILIWTDNQKVIEHNSNLIFSDAVLRDLLRKDADRLHIAMNYLEEKGLAKRTIPGYWKIR